MATLQKKTHCIISATLIGLILIIYLSSHSIIIDSYDKLEEEDAIENAICIKSILILENHDLENKAADWSVWDETYDFVQGKNSDYPEKYLMDETFYNQRHDFMLFYNGTESLVYERSIKNNNSSTLKELEEHLQNNPYLLEHANYSSRKTGFLVFNKKPVMITSQPVMKSDFSGPIAGTVIMGRIIDPEEITRIHETTNLIVKLQKIKNTEITGNVSFLNTNDSNSTIFTVTDDSRIYSYVSFNDIYGNDAFSIEVEVLRNIHQQGVNAINYFLVVIVLTGIVFGAGITLLLDRSHISRLKKLQNEVREIGENGDFTKRISYEGSDEVASLSSSINKMLESLEISQRLVIKRDATINAILQAMPDMMFQVKKDGTICNYKLSTDSCIYESPETDLNITLEDVLPAHIAEMELDIIEEALRTNKTHTMHYTMPVKREMRDFEVRFVVIADDEVLAVVKDITEIKQAEEMRRKDILLKEVHHRVKNNLQIISSMLRLQSRKFTDKETIEAFRKSQNRAKSMAIAHEKLYQSRDLENIELSSYIETLTKYLLNTYGCDPENIKIDIKIKNITQDIDTAIPLGLIINEIVSNSLKHAFKDHKGEIFVEIVPDVDGQYMLTIRDNGIGFPENLDFMNTDSLGMQLVVSLVEQIEGSIELIRGNGTEFRIKFKQLSYKRRDY
ncbi:Two-component sensor histidine kinase, contains HisKA and HATPase domains [Methanolobus vulcani]|uniref:histidine kinase n=1 Tax=Methanolobus vulcani TaxID=38026 RepID=A0A7Z7AU96_9EURY|nr:CHASE4 domain-containing protein [Methanolobus vulcani]SDF26513.1 Two-component sensor histidine kinase, contains HisKA and HATPase domains [Methanolobus vulcani]